MASSGSSEIVASLTNVGLLLNAGNTIVFEGATDDTSETTLTVVDPTADRTITLPDATGTVALYGSIALGTDTTGSYMSDVSAGSGISVSHTPAEGSTATVSLDASVNDLSDVTITSAADGNFLAHDGSGWVNQNIALGTDTTGDYVASLVAGSGVTLSNNSGEGSTPTIAVDTGTIGLGDLSGVTITSAADNNFLAYDGSGWVNQDIALGTDTTGDYVGSLVAGTGVTLSNNSGEGSTPTVAIGQAVGTSDNVTFNNVTVSGNLTVDGTTTTINSTTLSVDDKNIELGSVGTPTDTTADGGGITLKGATDKTFNWVDATDSWTSSEHIDLASGKAFYINGTSVLSSSALGVGVAVSLLSTTSSSSAGRIAWDTTYNKIVVGNGSNELEFASSTVQSNQQTGTTYTLVLSDKDKIIEMNNASANTLYVPADSSVSFPDGTQIVILQTGAGQTTVAPVAASGVTINATPGLDFRDQWSMATLIKRGTDTWVLTGDLSV